MIKTKTYSESPWSAESIDISFMLKFLMVAEKIKFKNRHAKSSPSTLNTYSMIIYVLIYLEHKNDVTSIVKLSVKKLDYACDVIFMF